LTLQPSKTTKPSVRVWSLLDKRYICIDILFTSMIPNPLPNSGYILTHLDGTQEYVSNIVHFAINKEHKDRYDLTTKTADGSKLIIQNVKYKALGKTATANKFKIVFAAIFFICVGLIIYHQATKPSTPVVETVDHEAAISYFIKESANDPSSYESAGFTSVGKVDDPIFGPGSYYYLHKYRAKNGFGGLILTQNYFVISPDSKRIRMIQN
jgi:hypothetical protein